MILNVLASLIKRESTHDMEFSSVVQYNTDIQFYQVVPTKRIRPKSKFFY